MLCKLKYKKNRRILSRKDNDDNLLFFLCPSVIWLRRKRYSVDVRRQKSKIFTQIEKKKALRDASIIVARDFFWFVQEHEN